ncbi:MAG: APC family permease [Acidobacteria bacterium]|nr:APC family permease [Acidobacteriota bacterium]
MSVQETNGPSDGKNKLLRILGVPFGLAVIVGGTVGVGILRSPGEIAGHIPSIALIMSVWVIGGLYSLLGANYMAELATSVPREGGPYVYAHRAIGDYGGFVVGWLDWLLNTMSLSYMCVVFGEYSVKLLSSGESASPVPYSVGILLIFTGINWIGLRVGSRTQEITSSLKAAALFAFVAACFFYGRNVNGPVSATPAQGMPTGFALVTASVVAFQLVLGTYSGWFSAVYFAEEDVNPARNMPRALFGGIALIIVIYVLVNAAILYVVPIGKLAGSEFAGADAMAAIFGERSGQIVTALALLSIAGIVNATLMFTPRTLFALGRDGLFFKMATNVNSGGTPTIAMVWTVIPALAFVVFGTFQTLVANAELLAVTNTILLITSLFLLRQKEPDLERPFKAIAYPLAPATMLIAAVLLFFGYIVSNLSNSLVAMIAIAASYPIFLLIRRVSR